MQVNKAIILGIVALLTLIVAMGGILFLKNSRSSQNQTKLTQVIDSVDEDAEDVLKAVDDLDKDVLDINQADFE